MSYWIEKRPETTDAFRTAQNIRLYGDLLLIAPLFLLIGLEGRVRNWQRPLLWMTALGTIVYNLKHWSRTP